METTRKMTSKEKVELTNRVCADSIRWSGKNNCYVAKWGFYFRHGKHCAYYEERLKAISSAVMIVASTEHWNAWPQSSWFEVRFQISSSTPEAQ